jgi:uncharacterized YkwD family protein/spore coat assembly protein SafA
MKRRILILLTVLVFLISALHVGAQSITHTVKWGDTLWKIAVKYQIGLSEIIQKNPQIKNPALIYPGQKITIPNIDDVKALEDEVIKLVNAERAKRGLGSLKANWQLSRVARYKSQDMVNKGYFSHTSPTYGSPFKMMESFGLKFSAAGENIAYGQRTPQQVMNAWMNSPGHRSNILNPSYTEIGVGLAKTKNGVSYWTQMFIKAY